MPATQTKRVPILSEWDIEQKVKRISYEILENNYDEDEIFIIGIKPDGHEFAKLIHKYLSSITQIKIHLNAIKLNKEAPTDDDLEYDFKPKSLNNKPVILVDDVANTGRTFCYALRPMLKFLPKSIQIAVLVDRKHKSFPICADYVGLSLSTTLKEHVTVDLKGKKRAVYLQ